ncbi:ABC-2 type transport system ATP-binding protein [Nocardioides scoriae]|uniref:ABC-2 type transport system ATP-binding protein n=1 Tax=Nocardioides scoriae TaxID=642780 RepID=A0A1H1LZ86_9ACTN|nr:ABC transporter ATP-binding protein [Nocardioides scoriae]SDR79365.1 ABC-2 type transport system ATP-binding protein [Nocardioides scoriae]
MTATGGATAPVVRTRGLTKVYRGGVRAVDGVDLEVREGDVYGFLGANGSGKTTTVRMLLGLVLASEGDVEVFGEPMPRNGASVLPRIGALVEGPGAYPHLSGRRNLALLDAIDGSPRADRPGRIGAVLEQVGLDPDDRRPARTYSLGMRQRLGLAGALLRRPPLLVLDEPTNGLDPQGIREMRELLLALNRGGTTIFLSSHLLAEIEQMSTRVGVLDRGRLVLQEDMSVLQAPTGLVRVRTPDVATALRALDGHVADHGPGHVVVRSPDPAGLVAHLVERGVRVTELGPERRTLEEIVLAASEAP